MSVLERRKTVTKEFNCVCQKCIACCKRRPGWFIPKQVPRLLKYFKVKTIKALLKKGIAIDWWEGDNFDEKDTLILAPNIVGNSSDRYPFWPIGTCVFLKKDRCSIYSIRPFECRMTNHQVSKAKSLHETAANKWKNETMLDELYEG